MTVREAIQSVVALTGAQSVCACADGGPLVQAGLVALNRAMQQVWASPAARSMALETATVTFPSTEPVDLPSNVLHVVGPARWNSYQPIPLAGSETDFLNYFREFGTEHTSPLWDELVFTGSHNVTGGFPWYNVEFYLPLWDDRAILIYFDNPAFINTLDPADTASPGGNAMNERTILVRVELPATNTTAAAGRALVLRELNRKAGQFLDCVDNSSGGRIRCYRRRIPDITAWTLTPVTGVNLTLNPGPRIPQVAWAEELKLTTDGAEDLARVRLHLSPPAAGSVTLKVTREPTKYLFTDLDCDGDGLNSTVIACTHGWAESIILPLARLNFAQDCPAYLTPQTAETMPAMEAAAQSARETLGLAAPSAPQAIQRNQTPNHAHS